MIYRKQAGDTIVEVLIAIAVVSLVLGGAYAIASRSLANSRQAQEHGEALQLANAQIELLSKYVKAASDDQLSALKTPDVIKCFGEVGEEPQPAACRSGSPVAYVTSFKYLSTTKAFEVLVTWPSVTGDRQSTVTLGYRPYLL